MTKTVKVKGNHVDVILFTIKDNEDTVKVSLWREWAATSGVGKFLCFTDVVVTCFNDEVSVSTTSKNHYSGNINKITQISLHT